MPGKGAEIMTDKQEKSRLEILKDEVLEAYLAMQSPKLSSLERLERTLKYEESKTRLAECIRTELT